MRLTRVLVAALGGLFLAACGGEDSTSPAHDASSSSSSSNTPPDRPKASAGDREFVATDLTLDVATLEGTAKITLAGSAQTGSTFEVGDLDVLSVEDADGALQFSKPKKGTLEVGIPASSEPAVVTIAYKFAAHDDFDGWMPKHGVSFLWPYFCGNLFPCKSDPADGLTFTLDVTGVAAGKTAVFPASIPADAPSYMLALAVGDYTELDLGATSKGTRVSAFYLPGQHDDAVAGTKHLREIFDFYETTYGAYSFGDKVATVSADWGPGDFGGMEHHPYFHVGKNDLVSEEVNAHEAAHGWFGDGVRIACWEDFVLSEGTVSYLDAHALEKVGAPVWADYACDLAYVCKPANNTIAYPDGCDQIDLLHDPLWSDVPYMKGAFFFRAVAAEMGEDALDAALAAFYEAHANGSAHMSDLVDAVAKAAGAKEATVQGLATSWLKTLACPADAPPCVDAAGARRRRRVRHPRR